MQHADIAIVYSKVDYSVYNMHAIIMYSKGVCQPLRLLRFGPLDQI